MGGELRVNSGSEKFLLYLQILAEQARHTTALRVFGGEFFPYALGESRVPTHENRDVGAQRQAQRCQAIIVPAQLP
ncbi:hypothetical protein Ddc_20201 [Ditylenchus destructor]|nr:hypothetical protein Ddc_20201 [Ditylenchus destructor]